MPLNNPSSGPAYGAEFTISAIPWVTSSTCTGVRRFTFRWLTKWFMVTNESAGVLRVGFTPLGLTTGSNYVELEQDEVFSADLRVKELYISGSGNSFQLVAGLTEIDQRHMCDLTSANGFENI